ncbi:LPS export ABC transporter permease LptG [Massilia sp. R2A-15]|uniref:LPS export ABC transporter permease LptG n=1 Tax=Massilia sp. R2A-15 TaxID=3064278 RepID=UPI002736539D|nr:LPS export ABC transporter permease LptG [Massilia sp. R2A-15]WLI90301.1 LPS export ABC transporter permease LptG [Massilia sp. R2A-15]
MKILQRYFAVNIMQAVAFALVAFLALTAFNDLTAELPSVGQGGYMIQHAFLYVLMLLPGHVYEVMPVAALIGTIYAMSQFAASSEFTIMRASSMSTAMAAWMLFRIGIVFVLITFVFGELITPRTAPLAERLKLSTKGSTVSQQFRSGLWAKDVVHRDGVNGPVTGSRFFNVNQFKPDGQLAGVKLYEFDTSFRLRSLVTAASAAFEGNNTWRLTDVTETLFSNSRVLPAPGELARSGAAVQGMFGQETSAVSTRKLPTMQLVSEVTPKILSVSSADPDRMSANELAVYTRHLAENKQENDRFKIAFWKKLIDPLAIFVLMALALPFAYLQMRSGGVSLKIFIGIMIGVSFLLVNTLFSHLGLLSTWPPLLTAVAPSLLYLLLALGALWRVERH